MNQISPEFTAASETQTHQAVYYPGVREPSRYTSGNHETAPLVCLTAMRTLLMDPSVSNVRAEINMKSCVAALLNVEGDLSHSTNRNKYNSSRENEKQVKACNSVRLPAQNMLVLF